LSLEWSRGSLGAISQPSRAQRGRASASQVALALRLFDEFHAQCFWHMPRGFRVRPVDLPAIVKGLRTYGRYRGVLVAAELGHVAPAGREEPC